MATQKHKGTPTNLASGVEQQSKKHLLLSIKNLLRIFRKQKEPLTTQQKDALQNARNILDASVNAVNITEVPPQNRKRWRNNSTRCPTSLTTASCSNAVSPSESASMPQVGTNVNTTINSPQMEQRGTMEATRSTVQAISETPSTAHSKCPIIKNILYHCTAAVTLQNAPAWNETKQVSRLLVRGEIVEPIEVPSAQDTSFGSWRVRIRTIIDNMTGWISVPHGTEKQTLAPCAIIAKPTEASPIQPFSTSKEVPKETVQY